jgi:hypothetical protein
MQSTIILPSVVWYILSDLYGILSLIWLQVFTVVKIQFVVFWLTEHCRLVGGYKDFR